MKKLILLLILTLSITSTSAFAYSINIPDGKWDKYKTKVLARYTYPEISCVTDNEAVQVCTPIEETEDKFVERYVLKLLKQHYMGIKGWENNKIVVSDDF